MNQNQLSHPTLVYRPLVKKLFWFVILSLFMVQVIILRINIPNLEDSGLLAAGVKLLVASSVVISIFIRLWWFVRPRIFSQYEILSEGITIQFKNKVKHLKFKDIRAIKFSILPPRFFGGFVVTMQSGQTYRFLSLLQDNFLIIERAMQVVHDLVEKEKIIEYVRTSRLVIFSWQRMAEKVMRVKGLAIKYLLVPIVLTAIFLSQGFLIAASDVAWENQFYTFFLIFSLYTFLAVSFNQLEENWVLKKVKIDESGQVQRDFNLERKISFLSNSLLAIFIGVLVLLVLRVLK